MQKMRHCSWNLRRLRLQIHLSTAIILMFAAAFLLWGNCPSFTPVTPTEEERLTRLTDERWAAHYSRWRRYRQGWPLAFRAGSEGHKPPITVGGETVQPAVVWYEGGATHFIWQWEVRVWELVIDVLIGVVLLIVVAVLCEWRIGTQALRRLADRGKVTQSPSTARTRSRD